MTSSRFRESLGAMTDALASGRRSFRRGAWADAHDRLVEADGLEPLGIDDLERLAVAAFLVGEEAERVAVWARAHQECLHAGDGPRAARCAFWLAFGLLLQGELAPAEGWLARGQRLLDESDADCVERGFLLVPVALGRLFTGDPDGALATFTAALEVGQRFADRDLVTFGRLGRGQALVFAGRRAEGVGELDEAMVAVTGGEVSPMVAGLVYCAVIDTCRMIYDLRRAHEWTAALTRWCEDQPDLVAYRGQCLVHRAEIMRLHGDWTGAIEEAQRAYEQLARPPAHPAVGEALYGLGDGLRLRGDLAGAEDAYRRASEHGRDPQPGLARVRLAQGEAGVAASAIRRAVAESGPHVLRAELLAAAVEILLAAGDADAAGTAAAELAAIADRAGAPALRAMADQAGGRIALDAGEASQALARMRAAWVGWRDLGAPYEAAQARVAIGLACRVLGDDDGAELELEAAERAFAQLGAPADLAAVGRLRASPGGTDRNGLTVRERQVLALVATGRTNRAIAVELTISEKTVARHVANIFTKLGLSSRAAATAYAYEHHLTGAPYTG